MWGFSSSWPGISEEVGGGERLCKKAQRVHGGLPRAVGWAARLFLFGFCWDRGKGGRKKKTEIKREERKRAMIRWDECGGNRGLLRSSEVEASAG